MTLSFTTEADIEPVKIPQEICHGKKSRRREWPFRGFVREGVVATWPKLLGQKLGGTPPCLDHRRVAN